ncbi:hypothetical protein T484DRAFT_1906996, partial [Baffinella frigidus]
MKHVLLSGALLLSLCASTLAGPPLFNKGGKGGGSKPGFGGGAKPGIGGGAKPGIGGGAKLKPDRGARAKGVIQHWSKDKIAAARPRDLQIDASGAGFIKDSSKEDTKGKKKGPTALRPYGSLNAQAPPDDHNHTIPGTFTFRAEVKDASGVKSVEFVIKWGSYEWPFQPSYMGDDKWSLTLQGFSDGDWSFFVRTTDQVTPGGGNDATT